MPSATIEKIIQPLRELVYRHRYRSAQPGSPDWLKKTELKYGGLVTNVA